MQPIQFNPRDRALFYETVKKKVKEYFAQTGKSEKGNWKLYWKTIILFAAWGAIYTAILFSGLSFALTMILYIAFGIVASLIGFNIMHDG